MEGTWELSLVSCSQHKRTTRTGGQSPHFWGAWFATGIIQISAQEVECVPHPESAGRRLRPGEAIVSWYFGF